LDKDIASEICKNLTRIFIGIFRVGFAYKFRFFANILFYLRDIGKCDENRHMRDKRHNKRN